MDLTEDIETKRLKQNINNLSIIEILRLPSLSLLSGVNIIYIYEKRDLYCQSGN